MAYEIEKTDEFSDWMDGLRDRRGQQVIAKRLVRAEGGNLGTVEPVGEGVSEMKIDFGPGYRLYFIMQDRKIVLLLCGGDKSSQDRDIKQAKEMASALKRKAEEEEDEDEQVRRS
jgi:putative addiction module killer protein